MLNLKYKNNYGKYAGTELKLDNVDYLIMRESDIFAIL